MITIILTLISIGGVLLNNYKRIEGFYCWTFSNFGWAVYMFSKNEFIPAFMFFVYTLFAIHGIISWKRR